MEEWMDTKKPLESIKFPSPKLIKSLGEMTLSRKIV